MKKKLRIIGISVLGVLALSLIVVRGDNAVGKFLSTVFDTRSEVTKQVEKLDDEQEKWHKEALQGFLNEIGIDEGIVEETTYTEGGANVVGGAKPAKSYSSLGLAQDAFKDYLGLHNEIESLKNEIYELTNIIIVNTDDFMQAIYSTNPVTGRNNKVITVKLSKKLPARDLVKVYFEDENPIYTEEGDMFGVDYKIYKSDLESDLYNLAWFTTRTGKSYSIDTKSGLTKDDFESLLDELIWNVTTMEDWKEHTSGK